MEKQMLRELKREMFDSIEKRLSDYMQGRIYPTEIASTFNYILYDEFKMSRGKSWRNLFRGYSLKPVFVGEYRMDPQNPYQTRLFVHQGTEACSPIPISRGIIGRAILERTDQYVPDVTKDKNHVGCDPNMEGSELVLLSWSNPYIRDSEENKMPLGVLDLDFNIKNALEEEDIARLRKIWDVYGKRIFKRIPSLFYIRPIPQKIAG